MIIKGTKINNRYSIIRTLGEGGMANVYLAYDTILDRNVAVKVLRGDLATDEKFVRRFQREALSASNLYHPNIVQIYDFDSEDGQYYIVMEYVEGKTLKQLLKRRGKTKYWLYKQMGMSYQNFNKMINNETKSIKYDNLEAMCYIFDCKIDELLIFDNEK